MKRSIPRSLVSKATNLDTNKERASGSEGRTELSDAVSTPFKGPAVPGNQERLRSRKLQ